VNVRDLLARTAPWLASRGSSSARLDAELLLAHLLGVERVGLYTDPGRALGDPELDAYRELVRRRGAGEPVAYLTGGREFYGLAMEVGPGVFIPRPETELLVDRARELGGRRILDLCTGSGCVAIACAVRLAGAAVTAVDLSSAALAVAGRNAARHGVETRVRLLEGDLFGPIAGEAPFDLVLANPPYVADGTARDVAAFEPAEAIFGGPGGLDLVFRILDGATVHLAPGGTLLLEIGEEQGDAVLSRARDTFPRAVVHRDLRGLPRVFEGRRPG